MFTIVNIRSRQVQREAYRTAGYGGARGSDPASPTMSSCSIWRPGRNIRDVRASVTRKQRADIRRRRANILDASAHPWTSNSREASVSSPPLRATPAGRCGSTSPGRSLGRAPLRESRLGRRYRRPGRCRTPGTSSADAGAHRPESRYGTGHDQPWHDHRLSTTVDSSISAMLQPGRSVKIIAIESAGPVPGDTMRTQPHRFRQTGSRTKTGGKRGVGPNETGQARHLTGPDLGF